MTLPIFVYLLPWGLVLLGGWLVWQVIRQNGRILLRLEALEQQLSQATAGAAAGPSTAGPPATGLPVGTLAPDFQLSDLTGAA